jgi:hypothetical protein
MTATPEPETTGDQAGEEASLPRATTYERAQDTYLCISDARERFEELDNRDITVRALATLQARGTYDPQRHSDPAKYPPLTADEHLEILAAGELLARHYRHPALVHHAVLAGATWPQIAAATGSDEATARQAYQQWADGQHQLYLHYDGQFGMGPAEHEAARRRATEPAEPEAEAG